MELDRWSRNFSGKSAPYADRHEPAISCWPHARSPLTVCVIESDRVLELYAPICVYGSIDVLGLPSLMLPVASCMSGCPLIKTNVAGP